MATAADKKRWDKLHADLESANAAKDEVESALRMKYGGDALRPSNRYWMSKAERARLEKAEAKVDKIRGQIYELVQRISPRDWGRGVPGHWVTHDLTWEDAIRPKDEPLSVVVPGSFGYSDGYVKENKMSQRTMRSRKQPSLPGFPDAPGELEIQIPNMPWQQIGGDMNPGAYGGLIATADGDHIELLEIQPVREYVGDEEAADVGFPFWTKEAWFDLADLDPKNEEVQSALQSSFDDGDQQIWFEDEATPEQRALVIAEALLRYGRGDEGPSGWSSDLPDHKVKWSSRGEVASLREYLADEDDEFRRDVLGEDDEEDEEDDDEEDLEEAPASEEEEAPVIRTSFTRVTWGDSGDSDDYEDEHGWIDEEGVEFEPDEADLEDGMSESESIVDQAIEWLEKEGAAHASSSHFHPGVWYTTESEQDHRTGAHEERSFHLDGFSTEEQAEIFKAITRRR